MLSPGTSSDSVYMLGWPIDHSAGLAITTVAVSEAVCPWARFSGWKASGISSEYRVSVPVGVRVRAAPSLCTVTVRRTCAGPALGSDPGSVVCMVGSESSLAPIFRTVTSPSRPPQLNQVRWNPSLACCSGLRQSTLTTTVCTPGLTVLRNSNGR